MSSEEQAEKCKKIHDTLAEYWNWAYYDTPHRKSSWLLSEYVKRLKPDVEYRAPIMIRQIEELLEQHPDDSFSILDVGCGVGGFIHRAISTLAQKYPDVKFRATGIDISSKMIEYAAKNLCDLDVELVCDNITNLDLELKNEPFDVAILMATLSFYDDENAKEILSSIHQKLKRDAYLVVLDFARSYRWGGFNLFSRPLHRLTDMFFSHLIGESVHFTNRTADQLKTLLNNASIEVTMSYTSEKKSKLKGMIVIVAKKIKIQDRSELLIKPRIIGK